MISDSIFTIHRFKINAPVLNAPLYLLPFGDVHRSADACDEDKWKEFLEWAKTRRNAYFLGMGDYDDFLSAHERQAMSEACLHDSTYKTIDNLMDHHVKRLVSEMSFMRGRLIGLIECNHYGKFQSGMTTTQEMCRLLECKYLGVSSFIRLNVWNNNRVNSIDIWAHHGRGSGRTIGASLNTIQQMGDAAEAHIYLMGHTHKKSVALKNRLCLGGNGSSLSLHHRKILLACTGSFLKGYVPDAPSYIAKAGLSPTDMGIVKIELTPKRIAKRVPRIDNFYVDIHASV